jgi:hypothetical protein
VNQKEQSEIVVPTKWVFVKSFATIGAVAGAALVFLMGFYQAFPAPGPPGTAGCGNAVIGAWLCIFLAALPLAIACSILAGALGALVDGAIGLHRQDFTSIG